MSGEEIAARLLLVAILAMVGTPVVAVAAAWMWTGWREWRQERRDAPGADVLRPRR